MHFARRGVLLAFCWCFCAASPGARAAAQDTSPRVVYKIDPEYSREAESAFIQGTVLIRMVITETGLPSDIELVSPLGFGLDERAVESVGKWRFSPAMKNGKPVAMAADVEVNFRFNGTYFDTRGEGRRTIYNAALAKFTKGDDTGVTQSIAVFRKLAAEKFPPALYRMSKLLLEGDHVPQDIPQGVDLLQKAAAKNHGPAMYELGLRKVEGKDLDPDPEAGMQMIREAAVLGSLQAQFYLGSTYLRGDGVPREIERARHYFRLCAAQGLGPCQLMLGSLLLRAENPEWERVQALAWLGLAVENRTSGAEESLRRAEKRFNHEQLERAAKVKATLIRRPV